MCEIPKELPKLPPVPKGFERWEYRGLGWDNGRKRCVFAHYKSPGLWHVEESGEAAPVGNGNCPSLHYIEAVKSTAPPLPPGLPPLPDVPEGYSHWVYRGTQWRAFDVRCAWLDDGVWRVKSEGHKEAYGEGYHYIEAIPATPAPSGEGKLSDEDFAEKVLTKLQLLKRAMEVLPRVQALLEASKYTAWQNGDEWEELDSVEKELSALIAAEGKEKQ